MVFETEEPTRPDIKVKIQNVPKVDLEPIDAVNGVLGPMTGYLSAPAKHETFTGEFIEPYSENDYTWDGLIPTPFPTYKDPRCRCTADMTRKICETILKGNFPDTAALARGISVQTFNEWMTRGKLKEEPFASFLASVTRACATSESEMVDNIRIGDEKGAGFGPAKAALELLGRRNPKRWSQQVRVEVADQLMAFLGAAEQVCDHATYMALLAKIAEVESEVADG